MRRPRQYQRSIKLVYGDQAQSLGTGPSRPFTATNVAGDGLRMSFTAQRNNRGEPDTCTIDLYALHEKDREAIKNDLEAQWDSRREIQAEHIRSDRERARKLKRVADAFRINIFVGYGYNEDDMVLLFRGDLIDVIPNLRRGGVDTITRLTLGDTLLALRDSYMQQTMGAGSLVAAARGIAKAMAVDFSNQAEVVMSIIGPNMVATKVENGWVGVGRPPDRLTDIIDQFGLQWWVRDGQLYFVGQGATLNDFSIQLREGRDILDFQEFRGRDDVRFRALLNPDIVPGRGIILQDLEGNRLEEFGHRVDRATYRGDTHGQAWFVDAEASGVDSRVLAPRTEFSDQQFTVEDQIALLDRRGRL